MKIVHFLGKVLNKVENGYKIQVNSKNINDLPTEDNNTERIVDCNNLLETDYIYYFYNAELYLDEQSSKNKVLINDFTKLGKIQDNNEISFDSVIIKKILDQNTSPCNI